MAERSILPVAYSSLAPLSGWREAKGHVEASAKTAELVEEPSPFAEMAGRYDGVSEAQLLLRCAIPSLFPQLYPALTTSSCCVCWCPLTAGAVQQGWPVLPKSSREPPLPSLPSELHPSRDASGIVADRPGAHRRQR